VLRLVHVQRGGSAVARWWKTGRSRRANRQTGHV
jgi:hypothetical protein